MLSGLTIRGRCLLAAGVAAGLCALVLDERDLLRVAVFVAVLPLLALALAGRTRYGLTARREIEPTRLQVGTKAAVRLRIGGTGRLPIGGLLLDDGVPHALGGRPHFRLEASGTRTTAMLEYPVTPALRGMHQVGPLRTRIGDPFGLCEFEQELAGRSRLIALPHITPLGDLPSGSGLGTDEDGTIRVRSGHGEDDITVRQYRHGDELRRVHWKNTARRDELMVRAEERPWHGGSTVLLDRRSAAHRGTGARSSVEWGISAVASICTHLHQHGRQVRLVTENGQVLAGGSDPSTGGSGNEAALDALAAVQPTAQRDLSCGRDPGNGQELIAVLGATTAVGVAELTKLRPQGARSLALLLDVRAWNGDATDGGFAPEATARRLRAAGWTVVVVDGPGSAVATAWSQLCRASRHGQSTEVTS
ncbi:DUF58 domain-containing protein [Parasphingorhabdus pacifica]